MDAQRPEVEVGVEAVPDPAAADGLPEWLHGLVRGAASSWAHGSNIQRLARGRKLHVPGAVRPGRDPGPACPS